MTLYEASSRFGISERKLQAYESYGILHCRLLRKLRFEMLNDIHKKQQSLDSVDFLIERIRQKGRCRS